MQTANIILNLGGDNGNQIPKYDVTPSEVAVLRVIHGEDAVNNIEVVGTVARTNRAEKERLSNTYRKPDPNGTILSIYVEGLFPGAAARLYEKFDELEIDEIFFKAPVAPVAAPAPAEEAPEIDLNKLKKAELITLAEKRGIEVSQDDTKAELIAAIESAPEPEPEDDEPADDMPDANLFN